VLIALLFGLIGCDSSEPDNRREIDKPARHHEYVPIRNVDEALQTEAVVAFAAIYRQIKLATVRTADTAALYQSLNGQLNAAKLGKIGMSERDLAGTHYTATDYNISIEGKAMTITAAKPGTRGYTSEQYLLP
jgi:hypothetical protein